MQVFLLPCMHALLVNKLSCTNNEETEARGSATALCCSFKHNTELSLGRQHNRGGGVLVRRQHMWGERGGEEQNCTAPLQEVIAKQEGGGVTGLCQR